MDRRQFSRGGLAMAVGYGLVPGASLRAAAKDYVIDTHAHVFHPGLKLADVRRYAPDYAAPVDLYLKQLDANGVTHGVLVQPSFLGTDNSYIVECLLSTAGRLRGIAVVDPTIPKAELQRLDAAGIVGIRLNLIGKSAPDLSEPAWKALLPEISRLGWQIEVQQKAVDLALLVPQLIDAGATVVVDHFGLPDPQSGAADPALAKLLKLATSGRLWVKVSAPYRIGMGWEAIVPDIYRRLRDALGPDRLIWGSDWPHTQFEASQNYSKMRSFIDNLVSDGEEKKKILAAPKALYRFG